MTPDDPDTLLAQTRAFNAELERLLAAVPSVDTVPPEQTRRARREGRGIFPAPVFLPDARTLDIDGPGGPIELRILAAAGAPTGAFLHIHGGGWTLGANDMQDVRLNRLAQETGLTVVSVGYRLAPENPYPAAPDDCEAAALWLLSNAGKIALGSATPLAIGGDSAGGRCRAPVRVLRPVDDPEPAAVGRAQPDSLRAHHQLVQRPVLAGVRPRATP